MATNKKSNGAIKEAPKKSEKTREDKEKKPRSLKPVLYVAIAAMVVVIAIAAYMMSGPVTNPPLNISGNQTVTMNMYQECAQLMNKDTAEGFIKKLVSDYYLGTELRTYILSIPKVANCSSESGKWFSSPYSFEIGDGYVTTTLNDYFVKSNFKKGIVANTMTIPSEDIAKGVFVYVTRDASGKLSYVYQLINQSSFTFDYYNPLLIDKYSIMNVPTIVFNCNQAVVARDIPLVRVNSTGEIINVSNLMKSPPFLSMLTCIHNKGVPESICRPLGIVMANNQTMQFESPVKDFLSVMPLINYDTGVESCRPSEGVTQVQAFYTVDCPECDAQRAVLNSIETQFAGALDVSYYCVGDSAECKRFVQASN